MKKNLLLVVLVLLSTSMFAQKLFTSLGGSAYSYKRSPNTTSPSYIDYSTQSYLITPRVGYYLKPNLILGLDLGYDWFRYEEVTPTAKKSSANRYKVGIFLRNIHKFNKYIGVWSELGAYSSFYSSTSTSSLVPTKSRTIGAQVLPGFIIFAGKHLSFEISYGLLSYQYNNADYTNSTPVYNQTSSGLYFSLSPSNSRFAINYSF